MGFWKSLRNIGLPWADGAKEKADKETMVMEVNGSQTSRANLSLSCHNAQRRAEGRAGHEDRD